MSPTASRAYIAGSNHGADWLARRRNETVAKCPRRRALRASDLGAIVAGCARRIATAPGGAVIETSPGKLRAGRIAGGVPMSKPCATCRSLSCAIQRRADDELGALANNLASACRGRCRRRRYDAAARWFGRVLADNCPASRSSSRTTSGMSEFGGLARRARLVARQADQLDGATSQKYRINARERKHMIDMQNEGSPMIEKSALRNQAFAAGHVGRPVLKAIREKCLDCCAYQPSEVAKCVSSACPLWPYRFGRNPFSRHPGGMPPGRRDHAAGGDQVLD
jgi:hypothetical protein